MWNHVEQREAQQRTGIETFTQGFQGGVVSYFFPKRFSVRGLLNCEHEPRGGTCWKSADFRAERPDTALVIPPGAPLDFWGSPLDLP